MTHNLKKSLSDYSVSSRQDRKGIISSIIRWSDATTFLICFQLVRSWTYSVNFRPQSEVWICTYSTTHFFKHTFQSKWDAYVLRTSKNTTLHSEGKQLLSHMGDHLWKWVNSINRTHSWAINMIFKNRHLEGIIVLFSGALALAEN